MIIKVLELCLVDYIKEKDMDNDAENLTAKRTVVYESSKETLLEAFKDYDSENFNTDNIVSANDEFDGGCLDLVRYLSVEEVED